MDGISKTIIFFFFTRQFFIDAFHIILLWRAGKAQSKYKQKSYCFHISMIIEATLYVTNNRYLDINPPKKKTFQGRCTDSSKEIKDHRKVKI